MRYKEDVIKTSILITEKMDKLIDEYYKDQNVVSRAEAIRQIMQLGIDKWMRSKR